MTDFQFLWQIISTV